MSMSSLSLLDEAPNSNLPSPVLTKMNSKVWNMSHFDEYEKQLQEEIASMKAAHKAQSKRSSHRFSYPVVKKPHKSRTKSKSHCPYSRQNSHLWTKNEMQ